MSAIRRRSPLIFAFYILNVRHISTSGLFDLLTYKVYPTLIIPTKFEVDMTIHCRVNSVFAADTFQGQKVKGRGHTLTCHTWRP